MSLVRLEQPDAGVVVLTLDDPDRRNALSLQMAHDFRAAIADLPTDAACLVITGSPPSFSAGGDFAMLERQQQLAQTDPASARQSVLDFYNSFLIIRTVPVPTIAAVNGSAVGAGFCLPLACDMRVVAESAKLGLNFARLGLHPGMGATALLPAAVGAHRAAQLLCTGTLATGAALAGSGWANDTCVADEVLPRALELARSIASASGEAMRRMVGSLRAVTDTALPNALDRESAEQVETLSSPDFAEGLQAIREDRPARFRSAEPASPGAREATAT